MVLGEMNNLDATLETIWELHDGISGAIHGISRSHFLAKHSPETKLHEDDGMSGFVFVKGFSVGDDDTAMAEARSLDAIRTALENVEHQFEFLRTLKSQQRAERYAALARLNKSRIILALRLDDRQGKKYKVIEEVSRFVSGFVALEILCDMPGSQPGEQANIQGSRLSILMQMVKSRFALAKNSPKWRKMDGVLGNVTLFAVSMLALLQLWQVAFTTLQEPDRNSHQKSIDNIDSQLNVSCRTQFFDVFSARG